MAKLGSLDQANYAFRFLFRLDSILHTCAAHIRCDSFGILNFASKPGLCPVWLRVVNFLKRHLSTFEVLNID